MGGSSSSEPREYVQTPEEEEYDRNMILANREREDAYYAKAISAEETTNASLKAISAKKAAITRGLAATQEGYAAAQEVTDERGRAIELGGKTMSKFERNEASRRMEEKKGAGNVKESDYSISREDRLWAKDMLGKPDEYWDTRRETAYKESVGGAQSSFCSQDSLLPSVDLLSPLSTEWENLLTDRYQSGVDYEATRDKSEIREGYTPRVRSTLLGNSDEQEDESGLGY